MDEWLSQSIWRWFVFMLLVGWGGTLIIVPLLLKWENHVEKLSKMAQKKSQASSLPKDEAKPEA